MVCYIYQSIARRGLSRQIRRKGALQSGLRSSHDIAEVDDRATSAPGSPDAGTGCALCKLVAAAKGG